ncbi:hypothetical protein [Caballeronia sp. HLA56]
MRAQIAVFFLLITLLADAPEKGRAAAGGMPAAPVLICHADPLGQWQNTHCADGVDCTATCTAYPHCDADSIRQTLAECARRNNCTPLVLHRKMSRLGCHFAADAFWVNSNARPARELKTNSRTGRRVIDFGQSSCRDSDQSALESALNEKSLFSCSSGGRHRAYALLLRHGCNVDLDGMGPDGPYTRITLRREKREPVDAAGIAPQPRLLVHFEPELTSSVVIHSPCDGQDCLPIGAPLPEHIAPICEGLAQLGTAHRLAVCSSMRGDSDISIRIQLSDSDTSTYTQNVEIVRPPSPPYPPPPVSPATTIPPTIAIAGAAGSLGLGALLAALGRWLFTRATKKDSDGVAAPGIARHDIQDVHVAVAFAGRPKIRVRRAGHPSRASIIRRRRP